MRLSPTKNRTLPAVFTVTEIVVAMPLLIAPEVVGALIEADSLALVMLTVRVWVSVSEPSLKVIVTI